MVKYVATPRGLLSLLCYINPTFEGTHVDDVIDGY